MRPKNKEKRWRKGRKDRVGNQIQPSSQRHNITFLLPDTEKIPEPKKREKRASSLLLPLLLQGRKVRPFPLFLLSQPLQAWLAFFLHTLLQYLQTYSRASSASQEGPSNAVRRRSQRARQAQRSKKMRIQHQQHA